MFGYIKKIEDRLEPWQKEALKSIYAPTVVATPLADSRRDVCILPDGEIRSYSRFHAIARSEASKHSSYIYSRDGGLTWQHAPSRGTMNSCTYFEEKDVYITVLDATGISGKNIGLRVARSKIGPDDPSPEIIQIDNGDDGNYRCSFLPQKSFFCDRIWFTCEIKSRAFFFFSDDWGLTWEKREIAPIKDFEIVFPHEGLRWCHGSGSEPYVTELSRDTMLMILRTPLDSFYKSYSHDGGNSWSIPEESTFYGTNTTAFLLRLSDGRIITFWNNTRPLPEPDHKKTLPFPGSVVVDGIGEDAFTNRDAAHAAISEDGGETFIGYREILLNCIRNNADFRYAGDIESSLDKSVHQFQAFELPYNKVLVSVGQNVASRRLVIFDVDWLYETSRREDFKSGLASLTAHTYLKSISGSHAWSIGNGHCSWNRTMSAYPMPDPDGGYGEALLISKHHDDRLINDIGGITWNFPASKKGSVEIELKIVEKQARVILTDRWYNTCDPFAALQSPFWFELSAKDIGEEFVKVKVNYSTEEETGEVLVNDKPFSRIKMTNPCPTGLSYLMLQCATDGDSKGFYVRSLEKKAEI